MNTVTIAELIAQLRKPGKAFMCVSGTELLIAIEKKDLIEIIAKLKDADYLIESRVANFGLHVEITYKY